MAGLAKNNKAQQINEVTIGLFNSIFPEQRKTSTFDNSKAFSGHTKLGETLTVSCYLANPYGY